MTKLDEKGFAVTLTSGMTRAQANPPFDFWRYVDEIPSADFNGYDCSEGIVSNVWRTNDNHFEHVLIDTKEDRNVFMVLVLDLRRQEVRGHRLLNLNDEYGLSNSSDHIARTEKPS